MNPIKNYSYILAFLLISFLLFITNWYPHTFLLGWDNIMPEFNVGLNLSRGLSAVWQEGRGLGLYDGMAHAANLVHTGAIGLLSTLFPDTMLRYLFFILMHLVGGVGFFVLFQRMFKDHISAFLGAFFYMFNLGVIQMFFAPLEVFAVHFAALPWLALTAVNALASPTRKNLLLFFTVSLLTTPQGFVPTVWLASFILLLCLSIRSLKRSVLILTIFLAANSFWLLPYIYGLPKTTPVIQNARVNQFSSGELYERNKVRGDLLSVVSMKGFMIDTVELDITKNTNEYFMDIWKRHTDNPIYVIISLLVILIALYGLMYKLVGGNRNPDGKTSEVGTSLTSEVKESGKQRPTLTPFILAGAVAFFFLANNTPLFAQLNELVRTLVPPLGEAFRIPFTKFITLFAFCFSIFFAYGLHLVTAGFKRQRTVILALCAIMLVFLSYPAFTGNFFSPLLKVQLPNEYQQTMAYLQKQPHDRRIALLPAHTYWNWQYRDFGQRGSDFLWYGLPQPILLRAFDPWSQYNEQFYNELAHAVRTENIGLFDAVMAKYNIAYALVDTNLVNNLSTKPINFERLGRFLSKSKTVREEKVFGTLILYRNTKATSWITTTAQLPATQPFPYTYEDVMFANHGHYSTTKIGRHDVVYPFAPLFFEKNYQNPIRITSDQTTITLKTSIESEQHSIYTLEFPSLLSAEQFIPARFDVSHSSLNITLLYPTIVIDGVRGQPAAEEYRVPIPGLHTPGVCCSITLLDTDQTITPGQVGYVQRNFLNSIKVANSTQEQLVTFDTRGLDSQPFQLELPNPTPQHISIEMPTITTSRVSVDVIKSQNYTIINHAQDIDNRLKCARSHVDIHSARAGNVYFKTICDTGEIASFIPSLPHNTGYLITAKYKYVSGLPLTVYVDNPVEKRAEFETQLSTDQSQQHLIIPATQEFFEGYGFHIVSKSSGFTPSISTMQEFRIQPFPTNFLKQIKLVRKGSSIPEHTSLQDRNYQKTGTWHYTTSARVGETLILSQAFDEGWKAYTMINDQHSMINSIRQFFPFIFGKELRKHVMIDNWANGWKIRQSQSRVGQESVEVSTQEPDSTNSRLIQPTKPKARLTVTIIFWPQYLQFAGFGIIFVTGSLLLIYALFNKD